MGRSERQEKQAGVIALWKGRICLVSSRGGRRWTIPKGCSEKGMRQWEVAGMEAWEEAGLEGRVHNRSLGNYLYFKAGRAFEVELFLMEVTLVHLAWPEDDLRKRKWIDPRAIDRWVSNPEICRAVMSVFGWSVSHEAG